MSNLKEYIRALESEKIHLEAALESLRKLEASRDKRTAPEERPDWRQAESHNG